MSGTVTALSSAAIAFLLTALMQKVMIPQQKLKALSGAENDPVFLFGGLPFILSVTVCCALILGGNTASGNYIGIQPGSDAKLWQGIALMLCFAVAGFADDSRRHSKNSGIGIGAKEMTALELLIITVYLLVMFFDMGKTPYVFIPLVGSVFSSLLFFVSGIIILLGGVNAHHLMRGDDKLYNYINLLSLASLCIIAVFKKNAGAAVVCSAAVGGLMSFAVFSGRFPSVVSGSAGMMFTGGAVCACAYMLDSPFTVLFVYAVFIIEGIYTAAGRLLGRGGIPIRIRLKKSGWDSKKITLAYLFVSTLFCTAGIVLMII